MQRHIPLLDIAGSIALLLWASRLLRAAVFEALRSELGRWISAATATPSRSFWTGLCTASLLQSSIAALMLALPCAESGILALDGALAAVIGADVGAALAMQVIAFTPSFLAPALILCGLICSRRAAARHSAQLGEAIIAVGIILLSLKAILLSGAALQESAGAHLLLEHARGNLPLALGIAIIATWMLHSSVAFVLLTAALAAAHIIDLETALSMVVGANLGSALMAWSSIDRRSAIARQLCGSNLIFRLATAMLLLPFVGPAARLIGEFNPAFGVAIAHLLFNLVLALIFLPFVRPTAQLALRLSQQRERNPAS